MNKVPIQSNKNKNELMNDSVLDENDSDGTEVVQHIEEFPDILKKKTKMALEQMEMMVMQQTPRGGLDMSVFTDEQKSKVLDLMHKNEENSFNYAKEKLRVTEKLNEKVLDTSIVNQKTLRYFLLGGGLALFALMVLVLFLRDQYFVPFLSFVTGMIGGVGLKSAFSQLVKKPDIINTNEDE
ncbi:hypothetical protein [Viscerimonas tarda]